MTNRRRALATAAVTALAGSLAGCDALDFYSNPDRMKAARGEGTATVAPENEGREASIAPSPAQQAVDRAQTLQAQGMYKEALREFEKAIETNPRLTVAYLGAGDIHRQQGDYPAAEKRYGQAASIEPSNFDAQYKHGLVLQLLQRVTEAVQAYLRALAIKPDDLNANLNLATAYLQLGEPDQALPYAQRAVSLDSKSAPARTNLGAIYSALGRHEEAVSEYQQASELTELTAPLMLNLADGLARTGRVEEAINVLTELSRSEPSAIGYERLGANLFRLRRYQESVASFRKALEIDPNHYPALNGVGVCLLNQYEWSDQRDNVARQEALRVLRRSLQIESGQPRILELVGRYQ